MFFFLNKHPNGFLIIPTNNFIFPWHQTTGIGYILHQQYQAGFCMD
jgi:hypothetical protein